MYVCMYVCIYVQTRCEKGRKEKENGTSKLVGRRKGGKAGKWESGLFVIARKVQEVLPEGSTV
jgi:hypothetical protein